MPIRFFLGLGSRYSYLAAARIADIAMRHHQVIEWLPVYSPDLIARAGADPFLGAPPSPQYAQAYRIRDVQRWAALYGLPFVEPDNEEVDWHTAAFAAVAAARLGHAEPFVRAFYARTFGEGRPPHGRDDLLALARSAGVDQVALAAELDSADLAAHHAATISAALGIGVFGVPTFVVDGELFWGNDRLVLLEHHLAMKSASC
jgi:2-hydroxychromene-2-carboxylate isomerase